MEQSFDSPSRDELLNELAILKRKLSRERAARLEAEQLLESKSSELYEANQKLLKINTSLYNAGFQRKQLLDTLINNLNTGVIILNAEKKIITVNQRLIDFFKLKFPKEEMQGIAFAENMDYIASHFKDPEAFIKCTKKIFEENQEIYDEIFEMKNGRIVTRDIIRIESESGFYGWLGQFRDITDTERLQKTLRESEEKYRGIIENMELGLLEVDLNHNIVRAYDWFCDMLGYTEDELVGRNAIELLLPNEYQTLMKQQDDIRIEGKQSVYEVQLRKKDGSLIWALISGAPIYDAQGNISGSVGIHYDITGRKLLEQELRNARNIAEKSRDAEKQFLANISHEIRNPINAIIGLTNLLYDTENSPEQLQYIDNIKYSADILLGLISGILDLSKIESGMVELVEQQINLENAIDALIQIISFNIIHKPVELVKKFDPSINFSVLADPTIINQIFLNLLGNASKFTEKGSITLEAKLLKENEESATIQFSFIDTGIGIKPERLDSIFNSFEQADRETKLKYGGTGLGLSIVKRLVASYQGTIAATSVYGEGTTFTVCLTLKKNNKENSHISKQVIRSKAAKTILIVEDNKINQLYLAGLLDKWGFAYQIAENGKIALELLDNNLFNLILMDIRMPVMDGYETTIRLRSSTTNANANIPIIALTASALVDEKERALAVGMNYHLTKPFTAEQLTSAMQDFGLMEEIDESDAPVSKFKYVKGLDQGYLDEYYMGDLERMRMMFEIFLRISPTDVEKLYAAWESSDGEAIKAMAHKLKPNMTMVGLKEQHEELNAIEKHIIEKGVDEELEKMIRDFFGKYENAKELVDQQYTILCDLAD